MDKLKLCAELFSKLFDINYFCKIGRKGKMQEFILTFDFPLIKPRLDYLYKLEEFMDSNDIIFNYEKRNNIYSNIDAVYLLQNEIDEVINYLFIDKNNDGTFFGRSFFPKEQKDYTIAQQRWTLLYKEKINLSTNIKIIQYDKLSK